MSENKESMNEEQEQDRIKVTNEELLKHLKELEIATGAIANGINTLFYIIDGRHKELQLDNEEKRMIASGMLAFVEITKRMNEVSGLKEESEKLREQKEKLMQEILKELFE